LPHLDRPTVERVLAGGTADPATVFKRSYEAAHYGATALPPDEARELRALRDVVGASLRGRDRQRMKAYDRMSPSRYLLAGEDARVMDLFTRGVRALPPERQQRLQELFGKAVAAYFQPRPAPEGAPAP
jgi:hypothetical protein